MGYLKNAGFVMLSLPQSDVTPLQLLIKTASGTVERLNASIEDLLIPQTSALPGVSKDKPLPDVQGEEELNMSISAHVDFLKGLTSLFDLKGSASLSYEQGHVFKIKLDAPKQNVINIIQLSGFIKDAKVNDDAGEILHNLVNEEIYVITETIKAKTFRIERADNLHADTEIAVNVSTVASASTTGELDKKNSSSLYYASDEPLTFAIKAFRIKSSGGGLFGGNVKYSLESSRDVERVLEGNFYGEPLEVSESLLNITLNER